MSTGRRTIGLGSRRFRLLFGTYVVGMALAVAMLLSGFHWNLRPVAPAQAGGTASEVDTTAVVGIRTFSAPGDAVIEEDVVYATEPDGTQLTLDVCSPADATVPAADPSADTPTGTPAAETNATSEPGILDNADPAAAVGSGTEIPTEEPVEPTLHPAVISVHGGSWARGDKGNSDWRNVCEWLASEGFVAYSVNYRLVPLVSFPAAIDDVGRAVEWMRTNAGTYNVDPDRIGAFGGSAGGNLATLLGSRGRGSGDRKSVV